MSLLKETNGIEDIIKKLEQIDSNFIKNGISYHYLDFEIDDNGTAVIGGNSEGLIHFATDILRLAMNGKSGSHNHYDQTSLFDKCDRELIFILKNLSGRKMII